MKSSTKQTAQAQLKPSSPSVSRDAHRLLLSRAKVEDTPCAHQGGVEALPYHAGLDATCAPAIRIASSREVS